MLTIEDVVAQVKRVDHEVDGITFRWNVTEAYECRGMPHTPEHRGYFIQIEYDEVDIDDPSGPKLVQQGRRWFVGLDVSPSEVLQTCLKAALASAEHRCREWFLVDGVRLYGPHQDAEELIKLGRPGSRVLTSKEQDAIHSDGFRQGFGSESMA